MRLGVRWRAGEQPHRSVPPELHSAILAQERERPDGHSWTLTWLEGRPRCTLDGLVLVTIDPAGEVRIENATDAASDAGGTRPECQTEDDDDWLQ